MAPAWLRGLAHLAALGAILRVLGSWPGVAGRTLGPWLGEGSRVYLALPLLAALALVGRRRGLAWLRGRAWLRGLGPLIAAAALLLAAEPLALRRRVLLAAALGGYVLVADGLLVRLGGRRPRAVASAWCGVALAAALLAGRVRRDPGLPALDAAGRGHLVLITLDTFREDALGALGATYGDTPHLGAFLAQGTRIGRAVAPAPHTHPSMATILTGLEPAAHGSVVGRPHLPRDVVTLAEHLRRCGYRTAGFFENPWMTREFAFDQGFETFVGGVSGRDPANEALAWLRDVGARTSTGRFYCHLHLFGAHGPYEPRSPWIERSSPGYEGPWERISNGDLQAAERPGSVDFTHADRLRILALYSSEVSAVDAEVGRVLACLDELGLADDTLVVIAADHGEELFDHGGLHHGHTLHGELLHVPWYLRWPGRVPARRVVRGPMGLVDLTPTVLDLLGLPALPAGPLAGQSRVPWIRGEREWQALPPVTSTRFLLRGHHRAAYLVDPWKLIVHWPADPGAPWRPFDGDRDTGLQAQLFHLGQDPTEQRDLASEEPAVLQRLLAEWQRSQAQRTLAPGAQHPVSPGQLEALRGMGYAGALEGWRASERR